MVEIQAALPLPDGAPSFNVANTGIGLGLVYSSKMSYSAIAEQGVSLYFRVHKIIQDSATGEYHVKRYGKSGSYVLAD